MEIPAIGWKITHRISLDTGRGLGASRGPGLNLDSRLSHTWRLGLGGGTSRCASAWTTAGKHRNGRLDFQAKKAVVKGLVIGPPKPHPIDMNKMQPDDHRLAADLWQHRGQARPSFAIRPRIGQESVWDYPRPPMLVKDSRLVEVRLGEIVVARTEGSLRVLETASPPTFYLPRADVRMGLLQPVSRHSFCEWKGQASYFDVRTGNNVIERAAWSYEHPRAAFARIAGHIAFYPGPIACYVDGERVRPQVGGFYGGWVTSEIVGPFKGEPGTGGW